MMEAARHNNSKKRTAVYEALCASKSHPTAEMLYTALKPRIPDLSIGTVYRSLATFKEEGKAISVGNVDGNERYDACTIPHPHLVCTKCCSVTDLVLPDDECGLVGMIESANGCSVSSWNLSITGVCADCLDKSL